MIILPDTSVIVRLHDADILLSEIVRDCFAKLERESKELVIVPQILVEFWVVATRPVAVNGLGMNTAEAEQALENLQATFRLLPENEQIFDEWKKLVAAHKVSGKPAHDARIVAAMRVHKINNILTLNPTDFKRYQSIAAVTPQEVLTN